MPKKKDDEYTFKRLQCWFRNVFQKYGWMVLSLEYKDNKLKIQHYNDCLKRLSDALEHKQVHDDDKK